MTDKRDLYEILEIPRTASDDEIKKAYKRLALKYHPDRNRDNQEEANAKFLEVNKAFKILKNPESKQLYDQHGIIDGENGNDDNSGMPGMPGGGFPFENIFNLFNGMGGGMGGMGGMPGMNRPIKSPDKKITVNISLVDVYNGKSIPLDFTRLICCDTCNGVGTNKPDGMKNCNVCNGKGKIIKIMQMGPMIQQSVHPCNSCRGVGKGINQGYECPKCHGKCCIKQNRHVDCYIRPGSVQGTSITFKGESDWVQECAEIGDLIVYVNCANEYGSFRREGDNLIMKKTISLLEALTITEFRFKHLDNRVLKIKYEKIIHPGQQMIITREGMSNLNDNLVKGDLIIMFDVIFPTQLDKERSKYLVKILPQPTIKKQIWDLQLDSIPESDLIQVEMKPYTFNDQKHTGTSHQNKDDNIKNNYEHDYDDNDRDEINNRFKAGGVPECTTQ